MRKVGNSWVNTTYQCSAIIVTLANITVGIFSREGWMVAGVFGCFGLAMFGAAGIGVYTGRTMQRDWKASRQDRPLEFWFQIGVYIAFGIICTNMAALLLWHPAL